MDFLRLFPPSTAESDQQQPLIFTAYHGLGLLCYSGAERNRLQLVVAATDSSNSSTQPDKTATTVLFKRISTIILSPELPRNARFEHILVSANGARVALVGRRMVFVVELDADFWAGRQGPTSSSDSAAAHLRSEYYAKCDLLHVGLFVRKFPPSVVRVRWFDPPSSSSNFPNAALLAVLFSDNIIRLYDVSTAMDRPLVQLDFVALLPDRTPEESEASSDEAGRAGGHSTLGFITQLVSFDFGPPQNGESIGSLLALDSNGQLYSALFPFDGVSFPPSTHGPLPVARLSGSDRLLCSALDLVHVRHSHDSHGFSLWALASEDGLLAHLVFTGQELFAMDCVEIGHGGQPQQQPHRRNFVAPHPAKKSVLRLQNEPGHRSAYFVICQSDVYLVDLSQLVRHLWAQCNDGAKGVQSPPPQSAVHQLLIFADGQAPSIGSLACLDTVSSQSSDDRNQQQLLAALCTYSNSEKQPKNAFLATILRGFEPETLSQALNCEKLAPSNSPPNFSRQSLMPPASTTQINTATARTPQAVAQQQKQAPPPLFADEVRTVLAQQRQAAATAAQPQQPQSLPAAVHFGPSNSAGAGDDDSAAEFEQLQQRAAQLTLVQQAVEQVLLRGQLPPRAVALDYAQKRASALLASLLAVQQFRDVANQRMTAVFRTLLQLKALLRQRQTMMGQTEQRVRRISHALQSAMFPASSGAAEQNAVDSLRGMQHRLKQCAEEIVKLDHRLRAHRQALCGGATPSSQQPPLAFVPAPCALHASHPAPAPNTVPAQMYMVSKNGRECAKLAKLLQSLDAQLNSSSSAART